MGLARVMVAKRVVKKHEEEGCEEAEAKAKAKEVPGLKVDKIEIHVIDGINYPALLQKNMELDGGNNILF
jgi:hypothetical protein